MNRAQLKWIGLFATFLAGLVLVYSARRTMSKRDERNSQVIGHFTILDGKIEIRGNHSTQWIPALDGEEIANSSRIRSGSGSAASIEGPTAGANAFKLLLSPNTEIAIDQKQNSYEIEIVTGEINVESRESNVPLIVATHFGRSTILKSTRASIAQPSGMNFASIVLESGHIQVNPTGSRSPIDMQDPSAVQILSPSHDSSAWLTEPGAEQIFASKEGFAAITFQCGHTTTPESATLVLRNLSTGEVITKEEVKSDIELTLPAGSYTWIIHSGNVVSSTRRFHINGSSSQIGSDPTSTSSTEAISSGTSTSPSQIPSTTTTTVSGTAETTTTSEATSASIVPPNENSDQTSLSSTTLTSTSATSDSVAQTSTTLESKIQPLEIKLLEPKKGAEIPFTLMSEQRLKWTHSGSIDFFEIDILGSSGNPSLHYKVPGSRSKQKLAALPPGRYTVRIRPVVLSHFVTNEESITSSFFDVIQTEAGQLAPSNLKIKKIPVKDSFKINLVWQPTAAPMYQIKLTRRTGPTTILRVKKSNVMITERASDISNILVCALDANLKIRGCAPELEIP